MQLLAMAIADAHLQLGAWSERPNIRGDAFWSFEQAMNRAFDLGVPLYSAGDLFDSSHHQNPQVLHRYRKIVTARQGIPGGFRFIDGNHDYASPPWGSLVEEAISLDRLLAPLGGGGYWLVGLNWQSAAKLDQALEDVQSLLASKNVDPDKTVLLCHQVWEEFTRWGPEGSLTNPRLPRYVITGDKHEMKIVSIRSQDGKERIIVSPGSLAPQSIVEPAAAYVIELVVDEGGQLQFRPVELLTRPMIDLAQPLASDDEAEEAIEVLRDLSQEGLQFCRENAPEEIDKPIAVVPVLSGFVSESKISKLKKALEDVSHVIIHPVSGLDLSCEVSEQEEAPVSSWGSAQEMRRSCEGAMERITNKPEWVSVRDDLFRLWRSSNPVEEVIRMEKEEVCNSTN